MAQQQGTRTPEFKRSNRILVPSSHSRTNGSFSSDISSSGGSIQPPLFIPKRRSFGIVIKAYDPDRIPARARRSRSRSRSGSRSRSASVSSLRSALNRAKSRSLGDIDMEGESIVEEEADRRRSNDINRQLSFRNLSSSPRRRSLSQGSMGSQDSRTSSDMVKSSIEVDSSRKPKRRPRSSKFSESVSPKIQTHNESVLKRDRSSSQSTLEVNYRLDSHTRYESNREPNRGRTDDIETRSRAAQYEIVQQRKHPSEDKVRQTKLLHRVDEKNKNSSTSNHQITVSADVHQNAVANTSGRHNVAINNTQIKGLHRQNSSQQDSSTQGQQYRKSIHSIEDNTNKNFPDRRLHRQLSLSSDEGTDLDDIPWRRTEDSLLSSMDSQPNRNEPQHTSTGLMQSSSAFPKNRSYMGSRNIGSPYSNIEEMQPMFPPEDPPKLPPKISMPQHHVTTFTDAQHHNHPSNKENFHARQIPPTLPPRLFSPRTQTEQMHGQSNNGPHSPSWSLHQPSNSRHLFPQQHCCGNHVGLQGFSGSNQINVPIHRHDQPPSRSACSHSASHATPCCNESFHSPILPTPGYQSHHTHCAQVNCSRQQCNGMHGNLQKSVVGNFHGNEHSRDDSHAGNSVGKGLHHQSPKFDRAIAPPRAFGSPPTVKFSHGSPKSKVHAENIALLNSQRQFKSTANFRSAGLLPASQSMHRAKSTDVLTVGGHIRSDPEVGNLDAAVKLKKTKSRIVLDDISLSSSEEFQVKSNKPKLSGEPKRGKLEMWSGLLHFFTICSCLLTTVTLALVSNHWDRYAHKCPLYVENNLQHDRYWGNPSMVPCYISAYLPLLVIIISVGLVFVHGGLLVFWRSDKKSASYYMTRSFGVTVTFFNIVAFAVALAVACVLTDGFRQTCLSFQLVTDYNFRPVNCQMGFQSLDLNYNIEGTLYLIIFGIIGAWISVIFTLISVVMYTIRAGCCRCTLH